MHDAVRLHTKAGIGVVGAAAVVLSPLLQSVPATTHLPALPKVNSAVQLTAAFNPLQPWMDVFNAASANVQKIGSSFGAAPAVFLQQILANQVSHLGAILQNPGSIGTVLGQVVKNVQSVVQAATLLNTDYNTGQAYGSLDGWHYMALQLTPQLLPTANDPKATQVITQVLNVLASPLSGVLMGLAGPAISPVVALVNTLTAAGAALSTGDAMAALQHLINIPANVVGGFLNGANLNLSALVPLVNASGLLTHDTTLHDLSLQFGGLLTAGTTGVDPVTGASNNIGGSILNSLGQVVTTGIMGFPLDLSIEGQGVGPIGALVSLGQLLAKAIGWSGTGNPLNPPAATPAAATQVSVTKAAADNSITSIPQPALAVTPVKATTSQTAETPAKPTAPAESEAAATPASSETPATPAKADNQKPDTTKPDATKPDATKPDTTKPDTTKPDATKPETTKSDTTKSDTTKSDTTKSDTTKSGTTKSDTKTSETKSETKSESAKPSKQNSEKPKPVKTPASAKSAASQGGSTHASAD